MTAEVYTNDHFFSGCIMAESWGRHIHFYVIGSGVAWLYSNGKNAQHLLFGGVVVFIRDEKIRSFTDE